MLVLFFFYQCSSVQSLSRVRLFATPWIAARQASLSITNSWSSPRLMSIESVMPSSHLILCRPLLLLSPISPSIRVFSDESTLHTRWPKYWSFSFSINPSKEVPGLISFRMDWLDLLAVHIVKGFSLVNEADVFLELSCLLYEPTNVGNLISAFSKPSCTSWKFSVHLLLKPSLKDFKHNLASMWNEHNCAVVWTLFGTALLQDWNGNWPSPVLWPLMNFPNLLIYWLQHFNSITF